MKTKLAFSFFAIVVLSTIHAPASAQDDGLIVHEWGTFTSFQGGDGVLMAWKPLETSRLPKFVYDIQNPGLGRISLSGYGPFGKGSMTSLQRMETPVIYFYSDRERTVDLTVKFPRGTITEWYPQLKQMGPAMIATNWNDEGATIPSHSTESLIHWSGIQILPTRNHVELLESLPTDTSGSHYFAARETDSDYIRDTAAFNRLAQSQSPEFEKFLFYRGVGNFTTPLKVTMTSDNSITVDNTGTEVLPNLFIVAIKNKAGKFFPIVQLKPGEKKLVAINANTAVPLANFTKSISAGVSEALVKADLYQREADAMVKTWADSWFAEDGVRVLYILPPQWTEATLPISMTPSPTKLVRVMVGRAEILPPATEKALVQELDKVRQGDTSASEQTRAILKELGRFAEPAFNRALSTLKAQPPEQAKLFALLDAARKTN